MTLTGLQQLTGETTWGNIWDKLFRRAQPGGYSSGQKIAIKVNLNNCRNCYTDASPHGNAIDALPQPVIGLITGLVAAGVPPADITVYDAIRAIPSYFYDAIHSAFPTVQFVGTQGCSGAAATGYGKHPSLAITFANPALATRYLADILYDATYVINMPIIKTHSGEAANPVTLSFKNHFGSINQIGDLHNYISVSDPVYQATYSPLADVSANSNLKLKTILILGDGLFGGFGAGATAVGYWNVFGGPANSLFFATDPVAVDCVMVDFLVAEGRVTKAHAYDYIFYAETLGLGVAEGTLAAPGGLPLQLPYGAGYNSIEYVRLDS